MCYPADVLKFDCAFDDMRTYLPLWDMELSRCGLAEFIGRTVAIHLTLTVTLSGTPVESKYSFPGHISPKLATNR